MNNDLYDIQRRTFMAIGHKGKRQISILCRILENSESFIKFFVINGEWSGILKDDGWIYINDEKMGEGEILWQGTVPSPYHNYNYNEVIHWIQQQIDLV